MSKLDKWVKGCSIKIVYPDEESAKYAVKRSLKVHNTILSYYKCEFCLNYHLSSKKQTTTN